MVIGLEFRLKKSIRSGKVYFSHSITQSDAMTCCKSNQGFTLSEALTKIYFGLNTNLSLDFKTAFLFINIGLNWPFIYILAWSL